MDRRAIGVIGALVCAVAISANATEWQHKAEGYSALKGDFIVVLQSPTQSHDITHGTAPVAELTNSKYVLAGAIDGKFIGVPGLTPETWTSSEATDAVKYDITIPETADWYLWVRASSPSQGDNSWYWAIDASDADAVSGDTAVMNILDMYESIPGPWTTAWKWYPFVSRTGPFAGRESTQWEADRVGMSITAGSHTLTLTPRERSYLDHFWGTTDQAHDPNVDPPTAVEPKGKLTTVWGALRQQ